MSESTWDGKCTRCGLPMTTGGCYNPACPNYGGCTTKTSGPCMCERLAAAELAAQILADGVSEEAETTESALAKARIDGARAFAEWLVANKITVCQYVNSLVPNDGYLGNGGADEVACRQIFARWLASESKEG